MATNYVTPAIGSRRPVGGEFTGFSTLADVFPQDLTGYREADYYNAEGEYLGADCHGVEPVYLLFG